MIQVTNLSKYYGGKHALGPVSFEIADGETIGFLGLNGAGKTTALRILACDLRPSSGSVSVGGTDAISDPHEVRKRIGFLPETPPLYGDMRVTDYLKFAAELRGMRGAEIKKRMPEVLDITDLGSVQSDTIGTLSHGFRQRVGVAQAIVHAPKFLILDEPTRGLDPVQIVEMRNLIHDLKQNHTVLISSHILTEISQTCDRLIVLGKGKMLGAGTEAELSATGSEIRQVIVGIRPKGEAKEDELKELKTTVTEMLGKLEGVTAVAEPYEQAGAQVFALSTTGDVRAEASRAVIQGGHDLVKLDYSRSELENTFIRLVGGDDASN
jgi:ABC-2 type transport system ATP-binding protein